MAAAKSKPKSHSSFEGGFGKSIESLAQGLVQKGTPGLILLALMFLVTWAPLLLVLDKVVDVMKLFASQFTAGLPAVILPAFVLLAVLLLPLFVSYKLCQAIIGNVVPIINAEASARSLTTVFGGRIISSNGDIGLAGLTRRQAETLTKRILKALTLRISVLAGAGKTEIRANVFVTDRKSGYWMKIFEKLTVNMDGSPDIDIKILSRFYSTGTAFAFGRAVFSQPAQEAGKASWPYKPQPGSLINPYSEEILKEQDNEIAKGHPNLQWIVSMPIPYQVTPFAMTCGVLNIDRVGAVATLEPSVLQEILKDVAICAALIGVMNKASDFLEGHCLRPLNPTSISGVDQLDEVYKIAWDEFNPSFCPEPSPELMANLSALSGLEFFSGVSPTEVAEFLRVQQRN